MKTSSKADTALVFVTLIASAGWLFSKFTLAEMPPFGFLGLRFLAASLLLGVFCINGFQQLSRQQWFSSLKVGITQSLAMMIWITAIASSTHLGEGGFITSMYMILIPVIARIFFGSRINLEIIIAFPVTILGLALLVLDADWTFEPAQGLFLLAAIFLAFHFNLNSFYGRHIPLIPLASIQLGIVGLLSLSTSFLLETWPKTISPTTWGWFSLSVALSTSLRFFLQTWAQKHSTTEKAAVIMVLEPLWIAIMSMIWLGETLTFQKLIGCSLILTALLISRWQQIARLKRFSIHPREKGQIPHQKGQNTT